MTFNYRTKDSGSITNTLKFMNVNFLQNNWHHIAVAVCGHDLALFIDGEVVRTGVLSGAVIAEREKLIIGQNVAGKISVILKQLSVYPYLYILNFNGLLFQEITNLWDFYKI